MSEKFGIPTIEELLKAGVHFGHRVKRWHPYMAKYIYSMDHRTHVIDIYQTRDLLKKACEFLYKTAKAGEQIVIVGTKRQAKEIVKRKAVECGAMFVNERWLGGTFTNYESVAGNWKRLNKLIADRDSGKFKHYTKKEQLLIDRKIHKLETFVGGIRGLSRKAGAIVIIDAKREHTAVSEAVAINVPIVGLVDTNCDPRNIDYIIPANDDAIKSIELMVDVLSKVIKKGYSEYSSSVAQKDTEKQLGLSNVKKEKEKSPKKKPNIVNAVKKTSKKLEKKEKKSKKKVASKSSKKK